MRAGRRGSKLLAAAGAAAAALGGASLLSGCGGGSTCGDGHLDKGELCPQLTVKWEFNKDAAEGFTGDSCTDLGIDRVAVELESDTDLFESEEFCSYRQVVFQDPVPGTYRVRVRPLSEEDELLTSAPVEQSYEFRGTDRREELVVNVAPEAWVQSYTGTFFFRVSWGGADCEQAAPPVTEQLLTLYQGDRTLSIRTTDGDPMDGSAPAPCRSIDKEVEPYPQSALEVPFGPTSLEVVGLDERGEPAFDTTFDTFVGAGASNPELLFDVDSLYPDAGMADGGMADAGPPDAGLDGSL